jgi:hypothetical protein
MNNTAEVLDVAPEVTPEVQGEKALVVSKEAQALAITDKPSYDQGCASLLEIKDVQKKLDEVFDPIITAAHTAHKAAINQKKKFTEPLAVAEKALKKQIADYLAAEEEKRIAEENRLRKEAERLEEERRLNEAIAAEAEGDLQEAEAILDDVPAYVPPVILPKTVQTGGGIQMRETWTFRVENLMELIKAVAAGKVPIYAVQANTVFLGQQARSMKSELKYPGVAVWPEKNIAAGRR